MRRPTDPTVAELVALLDDNLAEMFQERAAIREADGGYTRSHAEMMGLLDVIDRHPDALSGVTVFAFEIEGATHFVVTTDRDLCRESVERRGGAIREQLGIASTVAKHFGGLAEITAVA